MRNEQSKLESVRRFSILPKELGRYHSFPTLVHAGERNWLACRSGIVDPARVHGAEGCVRLLSAPVSDPLSWSEQRLDLEKPSPDCNELDAILSGAFGGQYCLVTRDYDHRRGSFPFLSMLPLNAGDEPIKLGREPVANLLDDDALQIAACFGHVKSTPDGTLLMPCYAVIKGDKYPSPVVLSSAGPGTRWRRHGVIARSDAFGRYLNEFSLVHLGGSKWLAVVRTDNPPHPLFWAESEDNGVNWSSLRETGLYGHAPMFEPSRPLLIYRDVSERPAGVALATYEYPDKWNFLGRLVTYTGGMYDGGYADVIALRDNKYLAAAYLSDEDGAPWIDGFLFSVSAP